MESAKAAQEPSHVGRLPTAIEYLRLFALDTAYIAPPGQTESAKSYKRRVYDTVTALLQAGIEPRAMRITQLEPNTECESM
jgi:hypothetical protein